MDYIDIELMEKMCHPIAVTVFDKTEDPIAKFKEKDLSLLDSALNNPRQIFDGKELYPTLVKKTAILYYGLIKNHPFHNGNKRIATATLLVFLHINKFWLTGNKKEIEDYLVNKALEVSKSDPRNKNSIIRGIENWLEDHIASEK